MTTPIARWAALIICLTVFIPASTGAMPFFKSHLPDFYQHQKAGPLVNVEDDGDIDFNNPVAQPMTIPSYDTTTDWWEDGGGWCCVTAFVNSFYFLEKQYDFDGLFTRTGGEMRTWQEQMIYAIEDLANDLFGLSGAALTIPQHVRKLESEAHQNGVDPHTKLTYSQFVVDAAGDVFRSDADAKGDLLPPIDVSADFPSLFDAYREELCRSEDVTVRWRYPAGAVPPGDSPWWKNSFHVVTGAGVADCDDPASRMMFFADPDKRNELEAGVYIDADVRTPYPYGDDVPLPIGEIHYEKVTLDANGCITDGLYAGACMVQVTAISVVGEPSSAPLLTIGLALLLAGIAAGHRLHRPA